MGNDITKKTVMGFFVVALLVLAFLVLKPILMAIIFGFILAYIFSPIYNLMFKLTKSPNFSASIITILLILIIIVPIWLFTPTLVKQSFTIYQNLQQTDFITPLEKFFPSAFASGGFSQEVGSTIHSFVTNIANSFVNSLANIILNFPTLALKAAVVLFTFFFVLRDKKILNDYIRSLLPLPKEVQNRFFKASKDVTSSVLYGQVIIGLIQGVVIGIGFFLFGASNAWVLTLLATIAGVLPIIGTMIIWLPVLVIFLITGDTVGAIGIFVFGTISSNIDNILRPVFVSRYTQMHSAVVFIGMIGGIFVFGILGVLLGPLVLSYLLIIFDLYRNNENSNLIKS